MTEHTEDEWRQAFSVGERSEHGRSTVDIECPYCQGVTTAYRWSLAGSGKKCDHCPALHCAGNSRMKAKDRG